MSDLPLSVVIPAAKADRGVRDQDDGRDLDDYADLDDAGILPPGATTQDAVAVKRQGILQEERFDHE